jgi:LacI family transcriptional regulator, galactose operon repressor
VIDQLLSRKAQFPAVVAFNDTSAIGMIRTLQDLNMRVPGDVSIVGFDDIEAAAYTSPRPTTVRQPLSEMGRIAARSLLNRLRRTEKFRPEITVEPSFVIVNRPRRPVQSAIGNPEQSLASLARPAQRSNCKLSARLSP